MTVLEQPGTHAPAPAPSWRPRADAAPLLPDAEPYRVLGARPDAPTGTKTKATRARSTRTGTTRAGSARTGATRTGTPRAGTAGRDTGTSGLAGEQVAAAPDAELLRRLYAAVVHGRRFNEQATALTRQGRLAVYPSSRGQEACQVAAALSLAEHDWLFPSYRDTLAAVARGLDPMEVLSLLRGDWHHGYDTRRTRVAPLCTPLATQLPHAVGLAHAARLKGDEVAALALVGDGGTSEGDFHEALNFAAVWQAPVVFLVQNNGFAISVPLAKQTAAPSLAHKAVGYGVPGRLVDGNDAVAVHEVLTEALERARAGGGPTLVEAVTYRLEAHTNADDATRYRADAEVEAWRAHDPVALLERELRQRDLWDEEAARQVEEAAEEQAAALRSRMNQDPALDPLELFAHVYAEPTPQLREQAGRLRAELAAEATARQTNEYEAAQTDAHGAGQTDENAPGQTNENADGQTDDAARRQSVAGEPAAGGAGGRTGEETR